MQIRLSHDVTILMFERLLATFAEFNLTRIHQSAFAPAMELLVRFRRLRNQGPTFSSTGPFMVASGFG